MSVFEWPVKCLEDLAQIVSGLTLGGAPSREPTRKVPYLRVANVKDGWLMLDDVKEIDATDKDIAELQLRSGDVVLTEGGDPDKLGRGTVWREQIALCLHQNHIFRVRFDQQQVCPDFAAFQFASKYGKTYFLTHARQTTGIASINKGILSRFPFRLPTISTQRRLATRLKSQMAAVEETRRRVEEQAKAAAAMPTRLLKEIFQADETGEWPVRCVGDACDFLPARSINLKGTAAVRAVTTACLQETGFTESGVKDALMMEDDVADACLSSGEILIARSNTPALVGRAALFEGSEQMLVASDLTIRLRARDGVEPAYAAAWFSYLFVTSYWQERASGASDTMKKIGRAQLAATDIPIPPLKTQRQIAARLREQFTHLQQLQKALSTQLEALDKLPGAFLREAFGSLEGQ